MRVLGTLLSAIWLIVLPATSWSESVRPARDSLPVEVMVNGVEFVLIPAGEFWYSMQIDPSHTPRSWDPSYRHVRIWLDDYYLAKYEARARDQERFMNAGVLSAETLSQLEAARSSQEWLGTAPSGDPGCTVRRNAEGRFYLPHPEQDLPATELSWDMAEQFARWMGFRLPTEAEWEKGARGPGKRNYPWGNDYPDDTSLLSDWIRSCDPMPVEAYPKGRSPYGLHNMAGNASEFVSDWYNTHFDHGLKNGDRNPKPADTGTPVPYENAQKIVKGGGWGQGAQTISARILRNPDDAKEPSQGVRFALDAAAVRAHLAQGTAVILRDKR